MVSPLFGRNEVQKRCRCDGCANRSFIERADWPAAKLQVCDPVRRNIHMKNEVADGIGCLGILQE